MYSQLRNSQSIGNGTGFKLRTLCLEQRISGLQGCDLRLDVGHLVGDLRRALCAIDGISPLGLKDVPDLGE